MQMASEAELRAKIQRLQGRIETHKHQGTQPPRPVPYGAPYGPPAGRGRGYSRGRGTFARLPAHRNRTLVLNGSSTPQSDTEQTPVHSPQLPQAPPGSNSSWVSKRDRHAQIINTAVYNERSQQRTQELAVTAKQRHQQRTAQEVAKLKHHFHVAPANGATSNNPTHEIVVNDLKFRLVDGGNKLLRLANNPTRPTPKSTIVAGVTFHRSKNGNLIRNGALKPTQYVGVSYRADQAQFLYRKPTIRKSSKPCPRFTQSGACPKGNRCRFVHNPDKIAICKDFLQKGSCPAGEHCDLSHDSTPHRVPACVHFLRGNCTNDECRYAHVHVNPGAPVCRAFATLGYCEMGASCAERHVNECPDYANTGTCRDTKCRLPHVDRAGQIRKAAALKAATTTPDDDLSPDLSSDEEGSYEHDSDDVDSDEMDDEIIVGDEGSFGLSQQEDFVHF